MLQVSILLHVTHAATVCGAATACVFSPVKIPANVHGGVCNTSYETGAVVKHVRKALCILFKWCFALLESVYT